MFETFLNFISGTIIGTIFLFIIMFFLIFMRWFRPVPRVSIPKNIPLESAPPETTTETINWIKLLSNNKYFEYIIHNLFSFGFQKYFDQIFPSDDFQNIKIEVIKNVFSIPDFSTVETTDPLEDGTVKSIIPLSFSNPLSIELNIILNNVKKVKCTISTFISKSDFSISIPYETGLIIFELKNPPDTKIDFQIVSIIENFENGEDQSKESSLNSDENDQIDKIKQILCENLIDIKLPIDIDTVPVEKIIETPPEPQEPPTEESKPEEPEKVELKPETKEKIDEEEYESDSDIIKGPLSLNLRHQQIMSEFNSLQNQQLIDQMNENDDDDTEFVTIDMKPTEREFSIDNAEEDEKNDQNINDTDDQ